MVRKLLAAFLLLFIASQASAGVVYQVSFDSDGAASNINSNLTVGGSQLFNIYFHEKFDGSGSFTPRIDLAGGVNGLTTANFGVNRTSGTTTDISNASGNAAFDFGGAPTVNFSASAATVEQEVSVSPVFATSSAADRRTVLLGSIQVTANSLGSTTFSLADFLAGNDDFIIDDGIGGLLFVADDPLLNVLTFGTLTITAVPEPSSLMLVGVVGCVAALRRRRAPKPH